MTISPSVKITFRMRTNLLNLKEDDPQLYPPLLRPALGLTILTIPYITVLAGPGISLKVGHDSIPMLLLTQSVSCKLIGIHSQDLRV